METGFNITHGADPRRTGPRMSNSEGGLERWLELGRSRAETIVWGADPELFGRSEVDKQHQGYYTATATRFRRDGCASS